MTRPALLIVLGCSACVGATARAPGAQPAAAPAAAPASVSVPAAAVSVPVTIIGGQTESATITAAPADASVAGSAAAPTASTPAIKRATKFCVDAGDQERWRLLLTAAAKLAPPPKEASKPGTAGLDVARHPTGDPDKEIIRRVIRHHITDVKNCYEPELTMNAKLGGRILVRFAIAASGRVITSSLQESTMGNARVEECTVNALLGWEFPKPCGGGILVVSYPFVLTPANDGE